MKQHPLYLNFKKVRRWQTFTVLLFIAPIVLLSTCFSKHMGIYYFIAIALYSIGFHYYKMRHFLCPVCLHNNLCIRLTKLVDGGNVRAMCSHCKTEMVTDIISKRSSMHNGSRKWLYKQDKNFIEQA